jgi:hypothetical protein
LEAGHRIQLPVEWVRELELEKEAVLEKVSEGILIHSLPRTTWDEVFANKLPIGRLASEAEEIEVRDDDLVY